MKNTQTRWITKWTRGLVALVVAIGLSPLSPIGLAAQEPPVTVDADTCWNNCGLEASLWMHENGKTKEEAEEWFHECVEECEEEEEGSSTC